MLTRAKVRMAREGEGRCGITWSPPRARSAHPSWSYPLVLHSCSPGSPRPRRGVPLSWFSKHSSLLGCSRQPISPPRPRRLRRRAPVSAPSLHALRMRPRSALLGNVVRSWDSPSSRAWVSACDTGDEREPRQKSGCLSCDLGSTPYSPPHRPHLLLKLAPTLL